METCTQNPNIERSLQKILATLVSQGKISAYQLSRQKIEGLYGRMLTKKQPKCADIELNNIYASLNYQKGDAYCLKISLERAK